MLHFLLIGAVLFGVFSLRADDLPPENKRTITLTEANVSLLKSNFEATWKREPDPAELQSLIDGYLQEEMLVREALSLGLDRDDAVVRQRLRQKMDFLIASSGQTLTPTEDELKTYLKMNMEQFSRPARIAFEQVYLGEQTTEAQIEIARAELRRGTDPTVVGKRSLLPSRLALSSAQAVDGTFGTGVFAELESLPVGSWQGPERSGYGEHFFRVTEHVPEADPDLQSIRSEVEEAWRQAETESLVARQYDRLRALYTIKREDLGSKPQ